MKSLDDIISDAALEHIQDEKLIAIFNGLSDEKISEEEQINRDDVVKSIKELRCARRKKAEEQKEAEEQKDKDTVVEDDSMSTVHGMDKSQAISNALLAQTPSKDTADESKVETTKAKSELETTKAGLTQSSVNREVDNAGQQPTNKVSFSSY